MRKYISVFMTVLLIAILVFPVSAFADGLTYLDPDEYSYDSVIKDRVEELGVAYPDKTLVSCDDDYNIYRIFPRDSSTFAYVTYTGTYNNHSYMIYRFSRGNVEAYTADLTNTWASISSSIKSSVNLGFLVFGDSYVKDHVADIKSDFITNADSTDELYAYYNAAPFTYFGSAVVGYGGTSYNGVVNFFPQIPAGTVLRKFIRVPTLQGVLQELIALLPLLVPVIIAYLALRKGYQFIKHRLQAA